VLCCARTHLSALSTSRIRELLDEDLDWNRVGRMALEQGVGPLLSRSLHEVAPERVPARVLDELREYVRANARRNLLLTSRLLRLLAAFRDSGIRVLPFKGALTAVQVYGDLTLRPFVDIDVLVHERDVEAAMALLAEQGYEQRMAHPWEAPFEDASGVTVDLHWGIAASYDPAPRTFDQLWARAVPVPLAGTEVPTFAVEDLLLTLSVQIAKDLLSTGPRLLQICDSAELIRRNPDIAWSSILDLARAAGGERMLQLDLLLAHELLEAPVPEPVLRSAKGNPAVRTLARDMRARLFPAAPGPDGPPANPGLLRGKAATYLRTRERWRDRLRFFGHRARERFLLVVQPTRSDREFLRLPAGLGAFYYLVRPVRVVGTWLRTGRISARPEQGRGARS
jgi:hypothetical protein